MKRISPARPGSTKGLWLGKDETRFNLPKTGAELARLDPVWARGPGNVLGDDTDQQHRLMQHLVVLEVVQQGRGHAFGLRGEKDRRARDAGFRGCFTGGEVVGERRRLARQPPQYQSQDGIV